MNSGVSRAHFNRPTHDEVAHPHIGPHRDLLHDLFLPTLLFVALGGMTWAVRGCAGFGAWKGCVFAGVTWGTAWWYLAYDPRKEQSRRYSSAWIVVALTLGIGIAGIQGWMQWPSLFEGKLLTDATPGRPQRFVEISRAYGFLWLFLAGVKWAGLGACLLAWCGSLRETRIWHWVLRIACGLTGAYFARFLIVHYPQYFLPLYDSIQDQYQDLAANPNLRRMMGDCTEAVYHLGFYLGFLAFEIFRRDWKNVTLILTVGLVNGAGWSLCQNWKWAAHVWPNATFNFWRCWESSGGLCMGLAFGLAYFLVNRRMSNKERAIVAARRSVAGPNFEWLLVFLGLTCFLSITFRFEVPWRLSIPEPLADWMRRHKYVTSLEWTAIWFAAICAFAAAYYFAFRSTPMDAAPRRRTFWDTLTSIEWVGFLLAGVLIAGLFVPMEHYGAFGKRVGIDKAIAQLSAGMVRLTSFLGPDHVLTRRRAEYSAIPVMQLSLAAVMLVGISWYVIRYGKFEEEKRLTTPTDGDPNIERFGLYLGLLAGLGLSLEYGIKGWFTVYRGAAQEVLWDRYLQHRLAPIYLVILLGIIVWILVRPLPRSLRGPIFPHAAAVIWFVLFLQNAIAQAITGPHSDWNETAFSIYYALLFAITAVTILYFQTSKKRDPLGLGGLKPGS
jgi:hypothetical protein